MDLLMTSRKEEEKTDPFYAYPTRILCELRYFLKAFITTKNIPVCVAVKMR